MVNRKKSPEKKRSHITKIAFTDREFEEQFRLAKATEMPLAVYCRHKILSRNATIAPPINQQVWAQLATPINDLSAIRELLVLAQQKNSRVPDQLLDLLNNELLAIASLRDSLLGKGNHEEENDP